MEDQGIMALPQAGMQAPTTEQGSPQGQAAVAAFDQARTQVDPREFGNELLSAAEQMDPAAVQEFRQALQAMNLPPEVIDALGQMVDAILAEPQNYQQIRAEFIAEGVPEDILPPEFDPAYFAALNMALDQMSGAAMPMNVQAFANGGIATLTPIAKMLAEQGRNGDTMLAHITPAEARMLRRQGGSGTINSVTGLPEFFVKKVAKAVGGALKSAGNAVSSAVKSVTSAAKKFVSSPIGKIVTTVALGFFLGPAAAGMMGVTSAAGVAAVSGFIGSAGSSLLSGGNIKDALKAGAIGGLTAGAMAGVSQGMNAFQAGSYTGPTTIAGQVDRFTQSLQSLTGSPAAAGQEISKSTLDYTGTGDVTQGINPAIQAPTLPSTQLPQPLSYNPQFGPGVQYAGSTVPNETFSELIRPTPAPTGAFDMGQFTPENVGLSAPVAAPVAAAPIAAPTMEPGAFDMGQFTPTDVGLTQQAPAGGFMDTVKQGYQDYIKPYTPSGIQESGRTAAEQIYKDTLSRTGSEALATKAYEKALPGLFSSYAPAVTAGMTGAYALGMFDPKQEPPPGIVPRTTGFDLYNQNPAEYGVTPGGAQATYSSPTGYPASGYGTTGSLFSSPRFNVRNPQQYMQPYGIAALAPRRFNTGGFAAGGGIKSLSEKYPRRVGQISGPGTETSDSIPAMLSDGEFVLTAKAVRGAGNGSRREGAKRMYAMMRKLERKANG